MHVLHARLSDDALFVNNTKRKELSQAVSCQTVAVLYLGV
jgi:hypothetical protein